MRLFYRMLSVGGLLISLAASLPSYAQMMDYRDQQFLDEISNSPWLTPQKKALMIKNYKITKKWAIDCERGDQDACDKLNMSMEMTSQSLGAGNNAMGAMNQGNATRGQIGQQQKIIQDRNQNDQNYRNYLNGR